MMFNEIYPANKRSLVEATIHMAEEVGEYTEALLSYRTRHADTDLDSISVEAADYVSQVFAVFNSLERSFSIELVNLFKNDCHACGQAPCTCTFRDVLDYQS
jgi:NTP pyrophosphatase (non-canonical NTP hydrolase)